MIELELPFPPSVNHYKQVGKLIRTAKGKLYQQRVNSNQTKQFYIDVFVKVQSLIAKGELNPIVDSKIRLGLNISLHPPTHHRMDIDNRAKVILDALTRSRVFPDDSQIDMLVISRGPVIQSGKVIVRIYEWEKPE